MTETKFIIYGLSDPETDELRYIGQSTSRFGRPLKHWRSKRHRNLRDHCHSWVRSVLMRGLIPKIDIIEELNSSDGLNDSETFWIAAFRCAGARLTNMTNGGGGTFGLPSPQRGKPTSSTQKLAASLASKGRKPWNFGKKKSDLQGIERQARAVSGERNYFHKSKGHGFGGSKKGRKAWNKELTRSYRPNPKISLALTGKKRSPEQKERYSLAAKKRWEKRKWHASAD